MKQSLTEQERQHLDRRIAEAERRTGAQIVLAVVERSDAHAELPWKAFALGTSAAGLAVTALELLRPGWASSYAVLMAVLAVLGTGVACALAGVLVPGFARLFLDVNRAEMEARQFAQSLFLSREIFATRERSGILLLVSIFERQVVALPDSGIARRLGKDALRGVIARMTGPLAGGQVAKALEEGLAALEGPLAAPAGGAACANELPDGIVEEQGP